jgi:hypothetical protein
VFCDQPDVEIELLAGNGADLCVAVNHSPSPVIATLWAQDSPDCPTRVFLEGKGVTIVEWTSKRSQTPLTSEQVPA